MGTFFSKNGGHAAVSVSGTIYRTLCFGLLACRATLLYHIPLARAMPSACGRQEGGARSIRFTLCLCLSLPCGASRRIRPALPLSLPAFIKRAAPVLSGPCHACARARHAKPSAASVRFRLSLCLRSPRGRRPFHRAFVSYAARACRADKGERGLPGTGPRGGRRLQTGPVCIMRYRHSAPRMVI